MTAARDMSSGAIPHPDNYMRHLLPEAAIHQPGLDYATFTSPKQLLIQGNANLWWKRLGI